MTDIDDYPCPNKVPYSFPVLRAGITQCSTYAVVSRLKLSPRYTITVSGGTFVHPDYPQVTLTVPQKAVETETRLPLELKVQEVPQEEFQGHDLFCGPILRILCSSNATFFEPVSIQLPVSLGNKLVHLPQPSECRVRIFFLSPEREIKEWVEISDKLENPASYDGKLVKFKVQRFSGYMCLLDRPIGGSVLPFWYLAYLSSIIWNQPLVATFFAYFDPKERLGSRNILFLICCPAHQSKDVKQELEKKGLTPCEATSRRDMIPGRDRAFVFVSGGISFASLEDMGGFYLRFNGNAPHKDQLQVRLISDKAYRKVDFRDTPNITECTNLLSTLNFRFSGGRQTSSRKLKVTLLSTEWGSTTGGLSTMNRELAIQLAKHSNVEVCMYLPCFSDEDERAAAHSSISLLKAKERHGYDPVDWLASIPRDHQMDVVIGHGIHLGRQVPHIRESHPGRGRFLSFKMRPVLLGGQLTVIYVLNIADTAIAKNNDSLVDSMKRILNESLPDIKRANSESTDSRLREMKKLKFEEPRRFKKKANEDQYRFNSQLSDVLTEAKSSCSSQQLDKVKESLDKDAS
ncbi:PREDICTED: uncharacterized protein LOC107339792 [Acropora digitifera]|uniref:uncharacterized protein LOC107339792 n=1 Tax=Acropora digitifera TaxID=70779 RepID=UPI00077AF998|nr:PREDICTED: uncharacterized protein LOC107339792 [Acropora digitifera]